MGARDSADKPLGLLIHVDREGDATADRIAVVHEAVREVLCGPRGGDTSTVAITVPARPHEPGHRARLPGGSIVLGNVAEGMLRDTRFAGLQRKPADWRLGGHVAPARGLPLRLVADPRRSKTVRSIERDDGPSRAIAPILTPRSLLLLVRRPQLNRLEIVHERLNHRLHAYLVAGFARSLERITPHRHVGAAMAAHRLSPVDRSEHEV